LSSRDVILTDAKDLGPETGVLGAARG